MTITPQSILRTSLNPFSGSNLANRNSAIKIATLKINIDLIVSVLQK